MDSELLTPEEAARFLNMSPSWLNKGRVHGYGPRFHKMGTGRTCKIRYSRNDLEQYLKDSACQPREPEAV